MNTSLCYLTGSFVSVAAFKTSFKRLRHEYFSNSGTFPDAAAHLLLFASLPLSPHLVMASLSFLSLTSFLLSIRSPHQYHRSSLFSANSIFCISTAFHRSRTVFSCVLLCLPDLYFQRSVFFVESSFYHKRVAVIKLPCMFCRSRSRVHLVSSTRKTVSGTYRGVGEVSEVGVVVVVAKRFFSRFSIRLFPQVRFFTQR